MKLNISDLRKIISEELVKASTAYQKKEDVRQELQNVVKKLVANGTIKSNEDLKAFWDIVDMSKNALKMIPIDVWRQMKG